MDLTYTKFVRKPFTVDAIEITDDNIAIVAELVGVLKHKENGVPYIQVDRRIVPNVFRVYTGFWMTKMGDNIRCYSKRIFHEQFVQSTPSNEEWARHINEGQPAQVPVAPANG